MIQSAILTLSAFSIIFPRHLQAIETVYEKLPLMNEQYLRTTQRYILIEMLDGLLRFYLHRTVNGMSVSRLPNTNSKFYQFYQAYLFRSTCCLVAGSDDQLPILYYTHDVPCTMASFL